MKKAIKDAVRDWYTLPPKFRTEERLLELLMAAVEQCL